MIKIKTKRIKPNVTAEPRGTRSLLHSCFSKISYASHLLSLALVYSMVSIMFVFLLGGSTGGYAQTSDADYRMIFDSNRSGSFGIYSVKLDGTDLRVVVDSSAHEMFPNVSPDASLVAYASGQNVERESQQDIWLASISGEGAKLLVQNGSFPSFSADGSQVYFLRERRKIMALTLATGEVVELFPKQIKPFAGREIAVPRFSADGRYLAFTVDYPKKWKTWIYDFEKEDAKMLGHGCEPFWIADSHTLLWVERGSFKSVSAISLFDVERSQNKVIQDSGEPFGQEYFPAASDDGTRIAWAACPKEQHSHYTSNYQLFWRKMETSERTRVLSDSHTNRWPKIYRLATAETEKP